MCIPRVAAGEMLAGARHALGVQLEEARGRGEALLARLNIPAAMWELAPAIFSGGEQQRVNIARGFVANFPILLLDEPTASLDAGNRAVVVELMREAKARGAARSEEHTSELQSLMRISYAVFCLKKKKKRKSKQTLV